jgi:adenylylsulfate kinase
MSTWIDKIVQQRHGFAVWLTGLPASGKTTLAFALADALQKRELRVQILDSDELREVLTPDPTYSQEERDWFYRTLVYIGRLLVRNGTNIILAATANRRRHRDWARQTMERFIEVYVHCSLETCMTRDQKGIYDKALVGQATTVPGVHVTYEPPQAPEAMVNTEANTVEECIEQILVQMEKRSLLMEK